ncbi:hypothetical protein ACNQS2_11360 [Corynebacterium diphtheriae]
MPFGRQIVVPAVRQQPRRGWRWRVAPSRERTGRPASRPDSLRGRHRQRDAVDAIRAVPGVGP